MTINQGNKSSQVALLKVSGAAAAAAICFAPSPPVVVLTVAQRCEQRLGDAMLSLARAENHLPAISSEIRDALAAGMNLGEITRCLGLPRHTVEKALANPFGFSASDD